MRKSTPSRPQCRGHHRGIALILVMVSMAMAMTITMSMIRILASQREFLQQERWRAQARVLAQGGLQRARQQLKQSPTYRGEAWKIPDVSFTPLPGGGPPSAVVQITVSTSSAIANYWDIQAQVDLVPRRDGSEQIPSPHVQAVAHTLVPALKNPPSTQKQGS